MERGCCAKIQVSPLWLCSLLRLADVYKRQYWQFPAGTKHLVVGTTADPRTVIASVQRELRALDPTVVIEDVRTLDRIRDDSIAPQLFTMRLLAGFSILSTALALIGIYGVLSLSCLLYTSRCV